MDRAAFVDVVRQLHDDLIRQPDDWENPVLSRFLEALVGVG